MWNLFYWPVLNQTVGIVVLEWEMYLDKVQYRIPSEQCVCLHPLTGPYLHTAHHLPGCHPADLNHPIQSMKRSWSASHCHILPPNRQENRIIGEWKFTSSTVEKFNKKPQSPGDDMENVWGTVWNQITAPSDFDSYYKICGWTWSSV